MCGICGIVDFGRGADRDALQTMTDSLAHRGPDDAGVFIDGPVGLGHRRLSIIDLSSTGHQPMQSDDGRYTMVYNGELYNFLDLRARLEHAGIGFRGRSDSEVLLKAFIRWGDRAWAQFNGMYAVAIWDAREKRLTIARDRFGIKPLYFARLPQGLLFGSEIKAVLAAGRVGPQVCWPALHEYMYYGNALGTHTMFDGVAKLLPAHTLTFAPSGMGMDCFWSVEDLAPGEDQLEEATRGVRERLERAVTDHLVSDVPVGVFLSGGVDSSAITALASRHYGGKLATFSAAFDFHDGVDELDKARRVAAQFGTDHHELRIAPQNIPDVIEHLVRSHDEPFADPADIPLFLLCAALRGRIKVILQGDGGDEIFAGYRRYNVLSHERLWRGVSPVAMAAGTVLPRGPRMQRAMRFFNVMSQADPSMQTALYMTTEVLDPPPTRVFSAEARRRLEESDPFARYRELQERFAHLDPVQRMLYIDSMVLLPDTFLEKVDKSTMAHSIEVRVPFLDTHLTDYAMALPAALKVRRMQKKWIIRRALRGIVPDFVLDGAKTGFTVPIGKWLRGPLAEFMRDLLFDRTTLDWGVLDRSEIERCIDEHVARVQDHWFILYKLVQLALWRRFYLGSA